MIGIYGNPKGLRVTGPSLGLGERGLHSSNGKDKGNNSLFRVLGHWHIQA